MEIQGRERGGHRAAGVSVRVASASTERPPFFFCFYFCLMRVSQSRSCPRVDPCGLNKVRRLGASADWSRERFTLEPALSGAVTEAFVRFHEDGLLYRGSRLVNWSPNLQTAVSDLEVMGVGGLSGQCLTMGHANSPPCSSSLSRHCSQVEFSEEVGSLYYFK